MPRCVGASLLLLAVARTALPADTGMLYVKSRPPGATVVIAGVERGKTPVLVKNLPAGDTAITLRIEGVDPVVVQKTVLARKVVTVHAEIDVPGALLTVISDPLEATVYLDGKEFGATPLTVEDLAPGRHQLVLLKRNFPRTARTIILAAGDERVLEVKLGTAEEDEEEEPAPTLGTGVGDRAKGGVPVEVQLILTMLKDAAAKGDLAKTRKNLGLALTQPDMARFKAELRAGIEVVKALEDRRDVMIRDAERLVGKDVTLKTRTGVRKGRAEGASQEGIVLVSKIVINGRPVGETRLAVKWADLHSSESDRLAGSWKPEGQDAEVARGILALVHKDEAEVDRVAAVADDHPLGKYLGLRATPPSIPARKAAEKILERIERDCGATRISVVAEVKLDKKIRQFRRAYESRLDSSLLRRVSLASARAKRASGLAAHWTFDEGRGTVTNDSSGRGNHGKIQGTVTWSKGRIGTALWFKGTGFVDTGSGVTPFGAADFTVSAWIRTSTDGGVILSKSDSDGDWEEQEKKVYVSRRSRYSEWTTQVPPGRLYFVGHKCGYIAGGRRLTDGAWHHVAVTWENGACASNTYVDGVAGGNVPAPRGHRYSSGDRTDNPGDTVRIGFSPGGEATTGFLGLIDDVRVYGRALSGQEVKALATAGR